MTDTEILTIAAKYRNHTLILADLYAAWDRMNSPEIPSAQPALRRIRQISKRGW